MLTVWAILGSTFYLALMRDGWARCDDYVDGHNFVAMVRTNRLMQTDASPRHSERYVGTS
jgi:hypothetical protein